MSEADEQRDPLEVLAAEFMERRREGQYPSISEYASKFPELAADIEELFPAIAAMEQLKLHKEDASGARVSLGSPKLERLGDFRILGEIGRGGMGIVYEAFQESLGRHVAVKVLPRQSLLDPKQLLRFQREAQTAARLHHTNIVPLFGVGEQDGYHYLVMQLIRGVSLDAVLARLQQFRIRGKIEHSEQARAMPRVATGYSSEAGRLARGLVGGRFWQTAEIGAPAPSGVREARPSGDSTLATHPHPCHGEGEATEDFQGDTDPDALSQAAPGAPATTEDPEPFHFGAPYWRSVATIGRQVADALHYAHVHHTLHRDIKPANLLLDSQGVVWITDFGLAKVMDQDQASQTGGLAGTLRYMAPEQFSGQIDARSDVYSLGLTLYELLTLQPAFTGAGRSSLIQQITQNQPARPRKLNPGVPRDLETIVLKAIAREPADRYQSAADLAHDLDQFLEDRPISARRASSLERLWRWSRRNPAVAVLSASTLLLLVLVAIVASAGYVSTTQANIEEAKQRKKAEATSALAIEALDNIFQQFAPERNAPGSSLLMVDDAGEEITVPVQPVLSKEAAGILEHMLAFYDRLAAEGENDAKLRRKVAEASRRVGDIRQRLGQYEESKDAYLRAIELYTRLANASADDVEVLTEIAKIQNELGNVHWAMHRMDVGHAAYLQALKTLDKNTDESTPSYLYELARTHYFLAVGPGFQSGPIPLAPGGQRKQAPGSRGLGFGPPGPPPDRPGPRGGEGGKRPPDSPDRGPNRPGPRPGSPPPSPLQAWRDREENLQNAIKILERLVSEHPEVPDYRHLLARCYRDVVPRWFVRDQQAYAENTNKAVTILQELVEEYPDVPDYRFELCQTYSQMDFGGPFAKEPSDAAWKKRSQEMLEKALAISKELVAEHPNVPDYAVSQVLMRVRLAGVLWDSDPAATEDNLQSALEMQSSLVRRFPKNNTYKFGLAAIHESLAGLYQERNRLPEARKSMQESIACFKDALESDPNAFFFANGLLARNYKNLADLLRRMGEKQAGADADREAEALQPGHRHDKGHRDKP